MQQEDSIEISDTRTRSWHIPVNEQSNEQEAKFEDLPNGKVQNYSQDICKGSPCCRRLQVGSCK